MNLKYQQMQIIQRCELNIWTMRQIYNMQNSPPFPINKTISHQSSNELSKYQPSQNQFVQDENQFSPLQLQNRLKHHKQNPKDDESTADQEETFINSNSIVKRYQLLLIACLIMASIASVRFSTYASLDHVKTIQNYFNINLLGNTNPSIYEFGDNIDESALQLTILSDMQQHFQDLTEVITNFTTLDAFAQFYEDSKHLIQVQVMYLDGEPYKQPMSLEQFRNFLAQNGTRQFLLSIEYMQVEIKFGQNKRVQNLTLSIFYDLSSSMMLNVELWLDFVPNIDFSVNSKDRAIRILEQLLAFFLLCSYLHNLYTIKIQNNRLKQLGAFYQDVKTLQKNRAFWCYSLVVLNLVTMLTQTYAPLASFLQLLPVFQRHDSANVYKYNFNTNLRYAVPLVLRIFIPVVIFLNGFIFYSMLMYPGEYFQDYTMGFFSYVYQNFQVGTYQIFTELEEEGNFAYVLYGVLYFYMVLVGNNLFPALFCTMIFMKIYQNDLKDYINRTIKTAICPKCLHQNIEDKDQNKTFEINISSPKISPYLKGKLSNVNKSSQISLIKKVTKMFVEEEQFKHTDQRSYLKALAKKSKLLLAKLQHVVDDTKNDRQKKFFLEEIQKVIIQVSQSIIPSPIRAPNSLK